VKAHEPNTFQMEGGKIECTAKEGMLDGDFSAKRVLIVDDQEVNLQITKRIIEKNLNGITCDVAMNGKQAVEMFQKKQYHFILMDVQMPIMGGFEATKLIKQINPDVPVIAYTSLISKEAQQEAQACGVDHYIAKPLSHNTLVRTITKWLGKKHVFCLRETDIKKILSNKRVICADDQLINNVMLAKSLKSKFNIDLDVTTTGTKLVKKFKQQSKQNKPYDLVLTDIIMEPGISGKEASRQIRDFEMVNNLKYRTPIIAITANNNTKLIRSLFRNGVDDYSIKGNSDQKELDNMMAFWVQERSERRVQTELLMAKDGINSHGEVEECEYYDNDYDKIILINSKISKENLAQISKLFIKSGSNLAQDIRVAFETNNIKQFRIHAHSLKGVAGNVGAERLYKFCHNLNEGTKEADLITISWIKKLEVVFEKTKEAILEIIK
jgi:CheY-like chemotaxis protein